MRTSEAVALLGISLLVACSPPLEPRIDQNTGKSTAQENEGGLLQRVEITPGAPRTGDTLFIRSTIVNSGVSRQVEVRTCSLDVRGLNLQEYVGKCQAYSMHLALAANDSISQTDTWILRSTSGDHVVSVRHLLDPERWMDIKLHVSGR